MEKLPATMCPANPIAMITKTHDNTTQLYQAYNEATENLAMVEPAAREGANDLAAPTTPPMVSPQSTGDQTLPAHFTDIQGICNAATTALTEARDQLFSSGPISVLINMGESALKMAFFKVQG